MSSLTITFDDPDVMRMLCQYKQFLQEEGVEGTMQEAAAGLIVGSLDENRSFARWAKERKDVPVEAPLNVTVLPAPKTPAAARAKTLLRAAG